MVQVTSHNNRGHAGRGNSEELIDRIYEAGSVPGLWPGVLQSLADAVGRAGQMLHATNALFEALIPAGAQKEQPPMIVHAMPIRGAGRDNFLRAAAVVLVTPVIKQEVPSAEPLSGLLDLTPAEARVARGIASGQTVEAIGTAAGISRETVRAQLKATLAKTGLNRQAELAALLAGVTLPRAGR